MSLGVHQGDPPRKKPPPKGKLPPCKVKPRRTVNLGDRSNLVGHPRGGNDPQGGPPPGVDHPGGPGGPPTHPGATHPGGPPPPKKDLPLHGPPQGGPRGKVKTKGHPRGNLSYHPGGDPGGSPLEEPPRVFPGHRMNTATAATREYPPQRASNQSGPNTLDPTGEPSLRREMAPLYVNAADVPVRRGRLRRVPKTNNLARSPRETFLLGATRVRLAWIRWGKPTRVKDLTRRIPELSRGV